MFLRKYFAGKLSLSVMSVAASVSVPGITSVAIPGGDIISQKEANAVQSSNVLQEKYRIRYLSQAYIDCVRNFNSAQIDAKEPVRIVKCKQLDNKEMETMKSSLDQAGFGHYRVSTVNATAERAGAAPPYTIIFIPIRKEDEDDEGPNRFRDK
jgi:hypothetical protein